MYDLQMRIRTQ